MASINGRPLLERASQFDNNDHAFSNYLSNNGWKGFYISRGKINKYIHPNGETIALAAFDNAKCFYRVWIKKNGETK